MAVADRRSARRFVTPGGQLRLYDEAGKSIGHNLVDFSHNSARYLAGEPPAPEQEMVFDLATAGHDINALKGFVVRSEQAEELHNKYFVVVKFFPFSTLEKYNTLENYQLLKTLVSEMERKGPDPRVR